MLACLQLHLQLSPLSRNTRANPPAGTNSHIPCPTTFSLGFRRDLAKLPISEADRVLDLEQTDY